MRRTLEGLPTPLGAASVLLLAASMRWAHHWADPRTPALVAGWSLATVGVFSVGFLVRGRGVRFVKLGVALGGVSLLALLGGGVVWAAGFNPAGACGGG
jgi:hypothetical protein